MCYVVSCDNEWPHLHIMPMSEILSLDTCEISGEEWTTQAMSTYVESNISYLEFKRDFQYEDVKQSILKHGFQPNFAPEIRNGVVQEGHHRITAMYDISGEWCPWQESENGDQWETDWEYYVYPKRFVESDA